MRVLIDTCILYPTITRQIVLALARLGLFEPLWSDRILSEWRHVTTKKAPQDIAYVDGEIALMRATWPKAAVSWAPSLEKRLWLPDDSDIHVLAAAISGSADSILTHNAQDFPRNILTEEGLTRNDPDGLCWAFFSQHPNAVTACATEITATYQAHTGETVDVAPLFKKARLPRFAKALSISLT